MTEIDGDTDTAFVDIPADLYPIHIEAVSETTGEVVWEHDLTEPGALLVPGLRDKHGPCAIRIGYGNGTVSYTASDGTQA